MIRLFKRKEKKKAVERVLDAPKSVVLVVDDEKMVHGSLREMLARIGCATLHAYSNKDVMRLLEKQTPDLVLLDIFMPGQNTLEILKQFKLFPHLQDVPVIIISGANNTHAIASYLKEGADDYLLKPFRVELLRVCIKRALAAEASQSSDSVQVVENVTRARSNDDIEKLKVQVNELTGKLNQQEKEKLDEVRNTAGSLSVKQAADLREFISGAHQRLNQIQVENRRCHEKFEHDLNNALLAISTAADMLNPSNPSERLD